MSILEGACDRIETHLYEVSFTADAHGLFTGKARRHERGLN